MDSNKVFNDWTNNQSPEDLQEAYEHIAYYVTFNDGHCSGSGYEEDIE